MKRSILSGYLYNDEIEAILSLTKETKWCQTEVASYLLRKGLRSIAGKDIQEVKDEISQLLIEARFAEHMKSPEFETELQKAIEKKKLEMKVN